MLANRMMMGAAGAKLYALSTDGTVTTVATNYKVHTFSATDTFTVGPTGDFEILDGMVEYLVVGGGGGAYIGAGGAGGLLANEAYDHPVTAQVYTITVGATVGQQTQGNNSVFDTFTALGGGRGGTEATSYNGGSGGGAVWGSPTGGLGTVGPPRQGYDGGDGAGTEQNQGSGGGGGAGAEGVDAVGTTGGAGGIGKQNSITGTAVYYAGGGGGLGRVTTTITGTSGGLGGGGDSEDGATGAQNGTDGLGGGGGAGFFLDIGGGGSGIIILRYKFQ